MRSSKAGRKTSSVASAVWHVAQSKCCQYPPFQFLWTKILLKWPNNDRHWLQRPLLAHFRKKKIQLCLWTKIRTKQWLVLGASAFQCMRVGFLCPKCDNFACLHTRQDQNEFHLKRWLFFAKICISCKSIVGPLPSVVQAYIQPYSFGGRIKLIII